jgi:hypothetical protein
MKRMFGRAAAATETNKRQQRWQRGFMVDGDEHAFAEYDAKGC